MSRKAFSANFAYNVLGALLPLITSLGTVPFYIHKIGLARYGVVTITWILLGYFGFLDFGLSRASANALAKLGNASSRERAPVLATAFCCNLTLGLVGGLILYLVGHVILLRVVKIPSDLMAETRNAYPWMAAMLPLGLISGVATGAMESRERFLLSNTMNSIATMAGQVIPLVCAYTIGPSLEVVIPATLLARLGAVMLMFSVVIKQEWPVSVFDVRFDLARKLFAYGSWVTVTSFINPLLNTSNQLIIGAMMGASSVAIYSVPMTLAQRSQIVATALARTLFPRSSRTSLEDAEAITRRASVSLTYGFGAVCAPAILICGPFLKLWIGRHFAEASQNIGQILLFGAWANGVGFLPYGFIQARGMPHITAKVSIIEILPFFGVLWFLTHFMGLPGAALAWTLRVTINCIVLFMLSRCLPEDLWRVVPAVALMLGSLLLARLVPMSSLASLGAAIIVGLCFTVLTYYLDPLAKEIAGRVAHKFGILRKPFALQRESL
jgi:O-antigen/teichoic acid export membrane protein